MKQQNRYQNLLVQFDRIFLHTRQGSFKTKARYAEAFRRFLAFLAENYRLERIANIAPKHLYAYVDSLTEKGRSPAYLKTELSAIRFFHDQIPNARFRLPDNSQFDLARRRFGGVDRTWSSREFNLFLARALSTGHEDYAAVFCLARYAGLRIHECFRLDMAVAGHALKTGMLTVKGKGGLVREVAVNKSIRVELEKFYIRTPRGQKLFVAPEDATHLAIHRLENFICYHKAAIQDEGSARPLTFHGLRHTYAAEQYEKFLGMGLSEYDARKRVAKLLGHGRDDVTRIYTASVERGGGADV